ncbi:DUF6455 family protein [Parasulfitobacter algicola]|uniref:DUF6455 domain-containing protein n=1 Tax=Parasulfitobacter algicola TaxID=2614809 RepID=A0ABX2IZG0_9RHOB|nr:DUF6455 family protein [Sulfitobacter algicola]NSX56053.1 hypothetical protein [Sulfitobacter algicola]
MTKPLGDTVTHYWLAKRMAKTAGVDLVAAIQDGRLHDQDWAETVTRCRGCGWAEGCQKWLLKHQDSVDKAPISCKNADFFETLKV